MYMQKYFEGVRSGHPDKVCDYVSDSVLAAYKGVDKKSHVACETFFKGNDLIVAGEYRSEGEVDVEGVIFNALKELGYSDEKINVIKITNLLSGQSDEINEKVLSDEDIGSGDQCIVFGYAGSKKYNYLPKGKFLIDSIMKFIDEKRCGEFPWLMMDGKGFVVAKDDQKYRLVVSTHVCEGVGDEEISQLKEALLEEFSEYIDEVTINPYYFGGADADCGLTGRKLSVDAYGGVVPHGGGCFSGKDPTKADRTGAYFARQLAVSAVDKFGLPWAEVCLGYEMGVSNPVSIDLTIPSGFNHENVRKYLEKFVFGSYGKIGNLIKAYNLGSRRFQELAKYGHFSINEWDKPIEG